MFSCGSDEQDSSVFQEEKHDEGTGVPIEKVGSNERMFQVCPQAALEAPSWASVAGMEHVMAWPRSGQELSSH